MAPNDVDILFEVKNSFYLGNFQQCINEANKVRTADDALITLNNAFMYRSYVGQNKYRIVLDELSDEIDNDIGLRMLRLYAELKSNAREKASIMEDVEKHISKGNVDESNGLFFLMAAHCYIFDGNYDSALRVLNQTDDLECHALTIQCMLKIDRVDLALKEMKKMQAKDEDATITQLANAWTNVAAGKDKLQDAFYIYQEMIDKYGESAQILVAQAACLIMQQKYSEAESRLQEALQLDSNNAEALINMISVSQLLGKPLEQSNRYISQLKEGHGGHSWTKEFMAKDAELDRICKQFSGDQ